MLRAIAPYLTAAFAISILAGGIYGVGGIGVPVLYAVLLVGILIGLVGYARWDERQHHH